MSPIPCPERATAPIRSARLRATLRRLRAPAAALALSGLAACAGGGGVSGGFGESRTTTLRYDAAHPISVAAQPRMIDIPADRDLSARDEALIDAFARDFLKRGEGDLTIAYPRDGAAARLVRAIAARVEAAGTPANRLRRGPYSTEVDGERGVVVSFYAAAALASECSPERGDTLQSWNNQQSANFGCASQNNLAAMLADPRDLVSPRPMSPISSARRQKVLQDYQAGDSTASEQNGPVTNTRNQ